MDKVGMIMLALITIIIVGTVYVFKPDDVQDACVDNVTARWLEQDKPFTMQQVHTYCRYELTR